MTGLILKDLLSLKKSLIIMVPLAVFYVVIYAMQSSAMFSVGFLIFLFGILPISSFSYDDLSNWNSYVLCLPVSKKDVVKSKYALLIILLLIGAILGLISGLVINAVSGPSLTNGADNEKMSTLEMFIVVYCVMAVCFIINCVSLPLIYKLGAENGRLVSLAVYVIPAAIILWISNKYAGVFQNMSGNTNGLVNLILSHPLILILILVCVAGFISYKLSLSIFSKKEY